MATTATVTQTTVRLGLLTLEVHGLIDRTVGHEILHQVAAYCVPRRLLRCIHVYGMRARQALMRLDITIDYQAHDEFLTLGGCGLPEGVAGEYVLADGPAIGSRSQRSSTQCPHIGKAVDLFMAAMKKRGLAPAWTLEFCERQIERSAQFGLLGGEPFTDRTIGLRASTIRHTVLPELTASCLHAPEPEDCVSPERQDAKRTS